MSTARALQVKRGLRLEFITITYNLLEAAGALIAGWIAGSIALVGFGLDSLIEVTSGAALVWRLAADHRHNRDAIERRALQIVGICFLALAAYVGAEAVEALWKREAPQSSPWGIAVAVASVIVMPMLARAKRNVADRIGSQAMHADAKQTDVCMYLSVILLAGLGLNAVFGWWWADPAAGLIMTPIIAREGLAALRGKACGCSGTCH